MRKLTVPILNILLALGVLFIIAGIFLLLRVAMDYRLEFSFLSFSVIFTGAVLFYLSLTVTHRALLFFLGLYLSLGSFYLWLVSSGVFALSFGRCWPGAVILSGLCLLITGLFKNHRLRTRYLFPSVALVVFGAVFLLFSLDIIRVSFFSVFSRWWPVLLVMLGLALVVLFLCQQRPDIRFPYDDAELAPQEDSEE